jgi:hypothetical protein
VASPWRQHFAVVALAAVMLLPNRLQPAAAHQSASVAA